jgi:4'-phosphopantetheinyl transferase
MSRNAAIAGHRAELLAPAVTARAMAPGGAVRAVGVGPASVGWAPIARPVDLRAQLAQLSRSDRERVAEFGHDRLNGFLTGRQLIHTLLVGQFGDAPEVSVQAVACRACGTRHAGIEVDGIPAVASVAYAAGLVVAAVAGTAEVSRLGVDVEVDAADPPREEELRHLLGASTEGALRRWTRVGAVLKADGRGLLVDPGAVWLRNGGAWIAGEKASYVVAEVPGPAGYLISLAWCRALPASVATGVVMRRTSGPAGDRWSAPSRRGQAG